MRILPLTALVVLPLAHGQPLEIRFDSPPPAGSGKKSDAFFLDASQFPSSGWESQAQPVGNGRIGAMVFGSPLRERIQFNESSLWTGGANPSGGYDINEFGAYQNFGDLFIEMDAPASSPQPTPVCASGHAPSGNEDVSAATDGQPGTKWCMEHKGREIVWQVDLGKARSIDHYKFTSANDIPARDPRTWRLEGSDDAKTWKAIDRHDNEAPFTQRGETREYVVPPSNAPAFRHYRLVFSPATDATHFQVAEISLGGIALTSAPPSLPGFSRSLDLATGIHRTTWQQDGVTHTREVFASHPDDAIIIRLSADRPGKVHGAVRLAGAHGETTTVASSSQSFAASLSNGLRYAAHLEVLCDNGKSTATQNQLQFAADAVTLVLTAHTDYALDPTRQFRSGIDPAQNAASTARKATAKPYTQLRSAHTDDFTPWMNRLDLDLGAPPEGKSITARLDAYKKGAADPHLEALIFQYGRYLLLSSSRDHLPANLQGLWNDSNNPAWYSDYHTNINLQMNYWLAGPANLSECAAPLIHWTNAMIPGSRDATRKAFGNDTPGWTMRTSVNIFGGNGWEWNLPASAWISQHLWEQYAFTGDKSYLAYTAWPVLAEVSEFWLDHLIEKNGALVVPKGWSPEHGPREDGVAHDQQIVWDLFTNTLEAAAVLGRDDKLVQQIAAARAKLLGPQVGSWGQLMEWMVERPDLEKSGHRHTSHLFAVYPGRQISTATTPEWARAAAVSLEARGSSGDSRRSWTWPWRTALWARLGKPDKAGEMIRGLLTHNTLPNLFTTHPPFQIDGNLGITAGICETLVQSHAGEIAILPALPPSWRNGSVRGVKARGGFTIDASWHNGQRTTTRLHSLAGNPVSLRLPGNPPSASLTTQTGETTTLTPQPNGTFQFPTKAGVHYDIR